MVLVEVQTCVSAWQTLDLLSTLKVLYKIGFIYCDKGALMYIVCVKYISYL